MKVEVIAREIVTPSASTLDHLQTIPFSALDQLATSNYVAILLFYPSDTTTGDVISSSSDQLKTSLSETLTHFYPIAGRIKDGELVDCNDLGVDFVEARVNCQLKEFLDQNNIDKLDHFLPCNPIVTVDEMSTKPLLAVQINRFDCGGICFGICFSHKVGDGVSIATFINGWAAVSHGALQVPPDVYFGLSAHFPVTESPKVMLSSQGGMQTNKIVTKRFVFDASNISELRELSNRKSSIEYPTRVELVSALIWWRVMAVAQPETKCKTGYAVAHAMNLRKRMVPMLTNHAFGNASRPTITRFIKGEVEMDYHEFIEHVRDSIKKVDAKYVMELQCGNEGVMDCLRKAKEEFSELVVLNLNSWCRFPFYDADFGWGTPLWVATTKTPARNLIIFIDTKSGDGIEAWINMFEEDMVLFEHDQVLLSFVSAK